MPAHSPLTYGQLYQKLLQLGFTEHSITLEGNPGRIFEHPNKKASLIVLPERDPSDKVETFYLAPVLDTLKRLDLLPDPNPLLL